MIICIKKKKKRMMYEVMTLYKVPLLYNQKTTNSAVNRNLASVINN